MDGKNDGGRVKKRKGEKKEQKTHKELNLQFFDNSLESTSYPLYNNLQGYYILKYNKLYMHGTSQLPPGKARMILILL